MGTVRLLPTLLLTLAAAGTAGAKDPLALLNQHLAGRIVDFSHNHGRDGRVRSEILGCKRDLYVYIPPNYDPARQYPLVVWLHGAFGDEHILFLLGRVEILDRLIQAGLCPPLVMAVPDATISGRNGPLSLHSFMVNGQQGRFEDHLMQEMVPFVTRHFSIRPERACHALIGLSAGGYAALNIGIKHRDYFSLIATMAPPANLRYGAASGNHHANFDPSTYIWREDYLPQRVVGSFMFGLIRIKEGMFVGPIFGPRQDILTNVIANNPADHLFTRDVRPGELAIFIHYPAKDNFNFDASAESFAYFAATKGISVQMAKELGGRHTIDYFQRNIEQVYRWLGARLWCGPPVIAVGRPPAGSPRRS